MARVRISTPGPSLPDFCRKQAYPFWALYKVLFENHTQIDGLINMVFDQIEYWVPITIYRSEAEVKAIPNEHSVSFKIPYVSLDGKIVHIFNRIISK